MKRSIVLLTVAGLLLAALVLGQEAQTPAKVPPAPSERVFFPLLAPSGEGDRGLELVDPLRQYGEVIKEATLVAGHVGQLLPHPPKTPQ